MSGPDCEECGEHFMSCYCKRTWRYVCPHCLRTFLANEYNEDWFCWKCGQGLEVIPREDLKIRLNLEEDYVLELKDPTRLDDLLEEDDLLPGYICRSCAMRLNAVPPKNHVCTWHRGRCNFCGEEANLCHTSDWNWPDRRYLEEDREI